MANISEDAAKSQALSEGDLAENSTALRLLTFADAEREIRRAIRLHDIGYVCSRLADCIVAITLTVEQLRSLVSDETPFIGMTGLAKQHVNDGLKRLEDWQIYQRPDNWYRFLVPHRWTAPLHSYFQDSPARLQEARQTELRLSVPSMKQEDWETGPNLDDELLDQFLQGGQPVTDSVTRVTNSVTAAVTDSVTRVTNSVTARFPLFNVEDKRQLKRSTPLNAQKRIEIERLDQVHAFFKRHDPRNADAELANSGGNYRKWIRLGKWDVIKRAMGEIEEPGAPGKGADRHPRNLADVSHERIRWGRNLGADQQRAMPPIAIIPVSAWQASANVKACVYAAPESAGNSDCGLASARPAAQAGCRRVGHFHPYDEAPSVEHLPESARTLGPRAPASAPAGTMPGLPAPARLVTRPGLR